MKRRWLLRVCLGALLLTSANVGAEDVEMDPLLRLLVEQGVITQEQAEAVPAEYARRQQAETVEAEAPVEQPQVAPAVVEQDPAAKETKPKWYDRIELKGDLRLRYEGFYQEGIADNIATYASVTSRSHHKGGVNTVRLDGSAQFLGDTTELKVWRALFSRRIRADMTLTIKAR